MTNKAQAALDDFNGCLSWQDKSTGRWNVGQNLENSTVETIRVALQASPVMGWQPIETAPRDGTEIVVRYKGGEETTAFWSDRPVCMLGSVNGGHTAGWATGAQSGTDYNLPIDPPDEWKSMIEAATKESK